MLISYLIDTVGKARLTVDELQQFTVHIELFVARAHRHMAVVHAVEYLKIQLSLAGAGIDQCGEFAHHHVGEMVELRHDGYALDFGILDVRHELNVADG